MNRTHQALAGRTRQPAVPKVSYGWRAQPAAVAHSLATPRLQAKLTIGAPDDIYEQEANRVADTVLRMPASQVQRACSCGGTCTDCQKDEEDRGRTIRRQASGEAMTGGAAPPEVERVLRAPGQPLPAGTRAFMEPRFGRDFSDVRIHRDALAARSAERMQAAAYTVGRDIAFAPNRFSPESASGRHLLAHELTHVVQQAGAAPAQVQRDRLPCTSGTTIKLYSVNLPGSTGTLAHDLKFANEVLCQCGIELVEAGGESWDTKAMDLQNPKGVLNEYSDVTNPTDEEKALMAHRPGGNVVHIYYVPSLSAGSRGETIGRADCPTCVDTVVVSNSAAVDTLAHEFIHVLLPNDSHHSNADNLFASGKIRNVGKGELEQSQCDRLQMP